MSKLERLKKDMVLKGTAPYQADCAFAFLAWESAKKALGDYLKEQRFTIPKIEGFKLLELPAVSGWECYLFGSARGLTLIPKKGDVPNWFWRKMQYLILGNRWVKNPKEKD